MPWEARFYEPQVTLADFCNLVTTHEHTLRAFDPHTRVKLSLRCSPAPNDTGCVGPNHTLPYRGPVGRILLAMACAHRDPLAWTSQAASRDHSSQGERALFRRSRAYPSRGVPGIRVADSNDDEVWRTASHFASTKVSLERHPAKADAVEKTEMPSTVREPLRERGMTPPRAPGPQLRHAAS